jgi:hypothetical protein
MLRAMPDKERRDLLLKAYDMERQDERAFWTTTVAYMGAAATILVTVTLIARPSSWGVWGVAPAVGLAFLAYYTQQASVGSRRRVYMESLESEICLGVDKLRLGGQAVRPLVNNRYTWFFSTTEEVRSNRSARWLFVIINLIPQLLFVFLLVTCVWRLWGDHQIVRLIVLIYGVIGWLVILTIFFTLALPKSLDATWEKAALGANLKNPFVGVSSRQER